MKRRWLRWLLIALIALLLPPTALVRYVAAQAYHLLRSLYLCNSLGLAAVGYVAGRDWYPDLLGCNGREFLSTVLAWFEVRGR